MVTNPLFVLQHGKPDWPNISTADFLGQIRGGFAAGYGLLSICALNC
jgi:hypothetical protein